MSLSDISMRCRCVVFFYYYAVFDFGANGDGATDNVKPFQNSLHAASAGGIGNSIMTTVYILIISATII